MIYITTRIRLLKSEDLSVIMENLEQKLKILKMNLN
jgi:hypothetical protein